MTDTLPLQLAVLTDHEHGTPPGHAKEQAQGAKVAILDPELIGLDVLEHLSDQATLLGMTILAQKYIGNQPALLVQHHQCVARERRGPGATPCLQAARGRG
jgi:hypothetical protein